VGAFFSGIGGGAFASSMSNISFFFPKSKQGLALGLNAGIGNLGVSLTQLLVPIMMTYAAFGNTDPIGETRVYNGAMWWFPFCIVFAVLGWILLSDMPQHGNKPPMPAPHYRSWLVLYSKPPPQQVWMLLKHPCFVLVYRVDALGILGGNTENVPADVFAKCACRRVEM
jgi:nitrate/nitrite transporter NarK